MHGALPCSTGCTRRGSSSSATASSSPSLPSCLRRADAAGARRDLMVRASVTRKRTPPPSGAEARPARPRSVPPFTPRPGPRRPPPAAVLPTSTLPATSAAGPAPPMPNRSALPSPAAGARAPPAAARPGRGPRRPPLRSAPRRSPGRARGARRRSGAGAHGSRWRAPPSPIREPPILRVRCAGARTSGRSAPIAAFPAPRSRSARSRRRLGLRGGRELSVLRAGRPQLLLQAVRSRRIAPQRVGSLLAARSDPLAADLEPGAALLDQVALDGQIEQLVRPGDAHAVQDVELGLPERRGHLVL